MNLKKLIEAQRWRELQKIKTPENCAAARNLLEGVISEKLLGEEQWWAHTANHRVITFYGIKNSEKYYVVYNTDISVCASLSDPPYEVSKEVLSVAVDMAKKYGISAEEFVEGKEKDQQRSVYRFEILV